MVAPDRECRSFRIYKRFIDLEYDLRKFTGQDPERIRCPDDLCAVREQDEFQ